MKDDTASASAETKHPIAERASNLLDIAKERAMRRAERQKVKLIQQASKPGAIGVSPADEEGLGKRIRRPKVDITTAILQLPELPKKTRQLPWPFLSFLAAAVLPTILAALYFAFIASPQYVVESQFAVRGANQSSLNSLGLTALVSSTTQASDSYVVTDYIHSTQILRDIQDQIGLDVRTVYAQPGIDFLYRKDSDETLDEFRAYWRRMINVSYNSTTGNVTLKVFAFTSSDAKLVADAILAVSERLVNTLSEKSRRQFISVANQQVARAEERLRAVRTQMTQLRQQEQAVDPTALATMESSIISTLEQELANLRTRYKALVDTISTDAPSARVLERQISALEKQLVEQKNRLSGDPGPNGKTSRNGDVTERSLPEIMDKFAELGVEQEFAVKAYTTSLAALETAIQDAQKQERYFAVYVSPREPQVALYPLSTINTLIVFLAFGCLWLIGYFAFRSVKDHAI